MGGPDISPSNVSRLQPLLVTRGSASAAPAEMSAEVALRLTDPHQDWDEQMGEGSTLSALLLTLRPWEGKPGSRHVNRSASERPHRFRQACTYWPLLTATHAAGAATGVDIRDQ